MKFKIPGLTFSWQRALGITKLKQRIARATGIPTTKNGRHAKLGRMLLRGAGKAAAVAVGAAGVGKIASLFKSKKRAEYIALKNIRDGKPANYSDITDPDYVTRPTYSTSMTDGFYTPQLTQKGLEALNKYSWFK